MIVTEADKRRALSVAIMLAEAEAEQAALEHGPRDPIRKDMLEVVAILRAMKQAVNLTKPNILGQKT